MAPPALQVNPVGPVAPYIEPINAHPLAKEGNDCQTSLDLASLPRH